MSEEQMSRHDRKRLEDAGWHVEERGLSGRVVAEWEDLGVCVSHESRPTPFKWWAWLHDENTAMGADTLEGALMDLVGDIRAKADQIVAFVDGKR